MRRQLLAALGMVLVFTVLTGIVYPVAVTGVARVAFHDKADGSLVTRNGKVVGSELLGQSFSQARYFHPRPSAAGDGYDASRSSGSNLGPTNARFLREVEQRVASYRQENGLPPSAEVPADAVTASGSGLDPNISAANARLQAHRVAAARGIDIDTVVSLIDDHTTGRSLGFLGEQVVNVLKLNLALDDLRG